MSVSFPVSDSLLSLSLVQLVMWSSDCSSAVVNFSFTCSSCASENLSPQKVQSCTKLWHTHIHRDKPLHAHSQRQRFKLFLMLWSWDHGGVVCVWFLRREHRWNCLSMISYSLYPVWVFYIDPLNVETDAFASPHALNKLNFHRATAKLHKSNCNHWSPFLKHKPDNDNENGFVRYSAYTLSVTHTKDKNKQQVYVYI